MGVVYRARDRQSQLTVALKSMTRVEPSALLRFKQEFRALSDISHPNVVELYEMVCEAEHCFFTMELLEGVDFLRWVRHQERLLVDGARDPTPTKQCDIERLRSTLLQLAEGVMAIHAAGKLHRDIKPSNVLVTGEGRVVLLDFGVVAERASVRQKPRLDEQILGTPAYMAPEQACGMPTCAAADWYAVGAMMYEALTDHLPFQGKPQEILFRTQRVRALRPSDLVQGVPEDLDLLCADLLDADPERRPEGDEVLRRLSAGPQSHRRPGIGPLPGRFGPRPLVGRKSHHQTLDAAFEASLHGPPVVVLLSGGSGMGKTVLAQHFLMRISEERGALVLSGRCFEREALPFKGMDSVVDELSRYLSGQPSSELGAALPADLYCLLLVFPVLRAVPCFAQLSPAHQVVEPIELRKRAFAALKELLRRLGTGSPLVLHIDDVQWSDIDSLVLLETLLQPPDAPRLLLVCGFRDEVQLTSSVLSELFALLERLGRRIDLRQLAVEPLSKSEAVQLAQQALAVADGEASALAEAIAVESQGVPIFVSELAEWQHERIGPVANDCSAALGVSLEQLIQSRIAKLAPEARSLLEVVAVANGPVPIGLAEAAIGRAQSDALCARLRGARLLRTFSADGQDFVEMYHARVRESVVSVLSPDRLRAWHAALAEALESTRIADPEALVEHYLGAGDRERARPHLLRAALAAENGLAFLRAARLYRLALETGVERARHELLTQVADALVNAGRSADAADAYREAAVAASGERAIELERRAAEHYLKSGRERAGLTALRSVLGSVGLNYPESPSEAVLSLLYHRARLRLRGLSFQTRSLGQCTPRELTRVDVAFSATVGLAMVDVVRGADFSARHLQLALDVGEPIRIGRALALQAGNAAAVGAGSPEPVERLVRAARELSLRSQDPHGTALAKLAAGLVQVFSGEWRAAQQTLDEAEAILRERCRGVTWELTNTQAWACNSLILRGDLAQAARRMPNLLREASERCDRYAQMHLIYPACISALAANDVESGWRMATDDSTFRAGEPGRFTAGHWGRLISKQSVYRYRGEGKQARAFVRGQWRGLASSQLLRVNLIRVFSEFERALSLVAALDEGQTTADGLGEAERSVKRILGDGPQYAAPLGHFANGCLAAVRGDQQRALSAFKAAALGLEAVDMGYLALCAKKRYAELVGGESGRALEVACVREFRDRGVVDSAACLTMSAPGFRKICP